MRCALRWVGRAALLALLYLAIPAAPGRTPDGPEQAPIWLVDHGYHVGLILSRADFLGPDLAGEPLARPFPWAQWFEIGWGDEGFYTNAHGLGDVGAAMALEALVWPSDSVLQIVALDRRPELYFDPARVTRITLDAEGRALLRRRILATAAQPTEPLGPGLYGASRFYRARPRYHLFNVCNHWLSDALNDAGLPSTRFWSTLPPGLLSELRWRGVGG